MADFNMTEKPTLEITLFSNNVQSILIEYENFKILDNPSSQSKFRIVPYLASNFTCDFIAHGVNCKALLDIYVNKIKNNFARVKSPL